MNEDANSRTDDGFTPLHFAAVHNKIEHMKLLLSRGAKVNAKNRRGDTPLHFVINRFRLNKQYRVKDIDTVEFLVKHGANVNAKNRLGETPLLYAVQAGFEAIVHVLLQNGADATYVDGTQTLPVVARAWHQIHLIPHLIRHGASSGSLRPEDLQDKRLKVGLTPEGLPVYDIPYRSFSARDIK